MTGNKAKKLIKIAREFNIGIATIVDYLEKKGKTVESNPNTKIDNESYELLKREFSSEISLKEASKKIHFGRHKSRKESISLDDIKSSTPVENETKTKEPSEDELLIQDTSSLFKKEGKENVEEEQESEKQQKQAGQESKIQLNVVGKIDLDKKEKQEEEEEKAKSEEVAQKQEKEQKEKVQEEKVQEESTEKPVSKKPKDKKISKEETEDKPVEDIKPREQEQPAPEDKKIEEMPSKEPVGKETADISEEIKEKEEFDAEDKVKFESDIRVIGKIDLDSLNQKTRPDKKTKEQKEKERQEKLKAKKATTKKISKEKTQAKREKPKEETETTKQKDVYKADVDPLSGPRVVGKIDFDEENKKQKQTKPEESEKPKSKKKRRKRIHKEPVVLKGKDQDKDKKEKDKGKATSDRKGQQRPQKRHKRQARKEVNEEDVQKQIKETLARLTSSKQKSKAAKHRKVKREQASKKMQEEAEEHEKSKNLLKVTEFVSVSELATLMDVPATDVISACMNLGLFVAINQRLDAETISIVADEFGYDVEFVSIELQENFEEEEEELEDTDPRAPIVTVMGHVDHGKTSLLDYIRKANVIAGEAGGITQHIGAYSVTLENGKEITFLDTPGHQAFTAMRARGAKVTDVAIIVVAADDNVMPQTVEAINHAQAAGVPIVFAINKIDKPGANPEKIKEELGNMNLLVEEWGGKYQSQDISAKHGKNIEELLEKVLLEAELLELKANGKKKATGSVIESSLDRGRGYVATLLVQNGTMKIGDVILAGSHSGKVKAMYNERNQRVDEAGPSDPVIVLGLDGAPQAGDNFNVLANEREARDIANKREQLQREQGLRAKKHITLDEIGRRIAIGNFQELKVVIKGDVDGSVEALADSLIKLSTEQIQVNVIHKGVGQISETDVNLAAASNAVIIGFQVRPSLSARKLAENEGIDIRLYSIIYDAINELRDAMEGMLSPEVKEEITGTAEIRETFKISKVGTVAGCMVTEGKIFRNSKVRVIRDGIVVYTGDLGSLKRFKEDVKEVKHNFECGLNIENFNDIKVGDIIEAFQEKMVKQTL